MNFPLGSLMDSMDEVHVQARAITDDSRTLLAVYKDDKLVLVLLKVAGDMPWQLGYPGGGELAENDAHAAVAPLVSFLSSSLEPKALDQVIGRASTVDAFLDAWVAATAARGVRVTALPPHTRSKRAYATLASLPASPAPAPLKVERAHEDDIEALTQLCVDFSRITRGSAMPREQAHARVALDVSLGHIWTCREAGRPMGYLALGRVTRRTIAIRSLYVAPEHQRKGVGVALTVAMTRYLLGAPPLEGGPAGVPEGGVKEQVCLNVSEEYVERIYKKCGFLLGEDDRDPVSGHKAWFASVARNVKVVDG
ncbi:GNAT family N-acetyltransferase [Phanerochaete sordida]|uniref:GNAT family N-acetyltransferase n=1 Tax=Phanerochaete sordida TaxID=48140 RepID=A0A9P3GJJ9_9APHY|nr:GNAT family N-acetyltransferase [Phanerochaete sordida]